MLESGSWLESPLIPLRQRRESAFERQRQSSRPCLLYTSDAADERSSVDLGGRRIIKKKQHCIVDSVNFSVQTKRQLRQI